MSGALEGIVVVALEQAVAAPLATSRLADAGARVIKLERPEGDFARGYDEYVNGMSSYFVWNNRGKESCILDLKQPGDLEILETMLSQADVFIQNLGPGATDRLGIASKALCQRYPRLIACDISGFSPGTLDADRKAYDLLVQAEAGLAGVTGSANSGPSRVGISICDIATGQAAYAAILEAIIRRSRTGKGSHLQLSLFDTMAEYMNVPYLARRYSDVEPRRLGLAHPSIAPYGSFETRDGAVLISIQNDREWAVFCAKVMMDAELARDARFARNVDRCNNRQVLDEIVAEAFARFHTDAMCKLLDEVRIAYGRISSIGDLLTHRSATTIKVATPIGEVEVLAMPVIVDGKRPQVGGVPDIGEHTQKLRAEFAAVKQPQPATAGDQLA